MPKPSLAEILKPADEAMTAAFNVLAGLRAEAAALADPDLTAAVFAWLDAKEAIRAHHAARVDAGVTYEGAPASWSDRWAELVEVSTRAEARVLVLGRAIRAARAGVAA